MSSPPSANMARTQGRLSRSNTGSSVSTFAFPPNTAAEDKKDAWPVKENFLKHRHQLTDTFNNKVRLERADNGIEIMKSLFHKKLFTVKLIRMIHSASSIL